jgi:hypothetical protein
MLCFWMKSDLHPSIGCSLCLLTGKRAMVIGYTFIIPHDQGPSCWLPNPYYESFGGGKVYYGMSLVRPIPPRNGPSSLVG